jgi:uncharacterized protein YbaA (DUF1428 family)
MDVDGLTTRRARRCTCESPNRVDSIFLNPRRPDMRYVDGFVIPISKKKLSAYRGIAQKAGKIWMHHGALEYLECVGDDFKVMCGLPFPRLAKAKKGETVLFSLIVYKSRKHRDTVNAKVMKDPRLTKICDPADMPFDAKRMAYGGFKAIVDF